MRKCILSVLAICISLLFYNNGTAQNYLSAKGKAIVNESGDTLILRAMGLGGWMLQEGYMLQTADFASAQFEIKNKIEELIGIEDTELFYDAWLQNHVQRSDIDSMASWGFNAVRLPMHYNLFTLPVQDEPITDQHTWLNKGFELTDSLISWCKQNEMYVLLDLHGAPGGQGYESAISDYDPTKPSLWESKANRNKTVALWKKLAERYADEPWVMGYDLLNETNWNMDNGIQLRNLFREITDSIRTVDNKHMIFIEGNWFANDFTGLTPPWDDNLVYSPHKYWSENETKDIQWALTIRDNYNVPIYFGESGENSNTWFADAITLFEEEGIGWAWWPLKKVESISCPLSVVKTPEYEDLLDYWKGNAPKPDKAFAKATLMELAENLKTENCVFQKDVIDAMFRQVKDPLSTIPFNIQDIPGVVYSSDFSMGTNGNAYFDTGVADYHITTGNYTSWNNGWAYRNDGVDIEKITDNVNSNGYGLGWMDQQEWMKYDIQVNENAVYKVKLRIASNQAGGQFHLEHNGGEISKIKTVQNTNGWANWQNLELQDVILTEDMNSFVMYIDKDGFNLNSLEFIKTGEMDAVMTDFLTAATIGNNSIRLILNKPMNAPLPSGTAGFIIRVNGSSSTITNIEFDPKNQRAIQFSISQIMKSSDAIRISYSGNELFAIDNTPLQSFSNKVVTNKIENYHPVPGKIEAEDYHYQLGVQLENCNDTGGGKNIGYLDPGDYLDYFINVDKSGTYDVEYRTAAESAVGKVEMQKVNNDGSVTPLHSIVFAPTGGWQNWRSTNKQVTLTSGKHKIRIAILKSQFNMNWFEFSFLSSTEQENLTTGIQLFPNPSSGLFHLDANFENIQNISMKIIDVTGRTLTTKLYSNSSEIEDKIDLNALEDGMYFLHMMAGNKTVAVKKLIKVKD